MDFSLCIAQTVVPDLRDLHVSLTVELQHATYIVLVDPLRVLAQTLGDNFFNKLVIVEFRMGRGDFFCRVRIPVQDVIQSLIVR